jgi:hypothetical protein
VVAFPLDTFEPDQMEPSKDECGRRLAVLWNVPAGLADAKPYFGPVSGGTVGRGVVRTGPVWRGEF